MDVSEIPLALPEGEEASQALVPLASIRPNNPAEEGTSNDGFIILFHRYFQLSSNFFLITFYFSILRWTELGNSNAVSVYRPGRIVPSIAHPHGHFRVMPPTSIKIDT